MSTPATPPAGDKATLGPTSADQVWTFVVLAGGGAVILALGPLLAAWLSDVPWIPFSDALRWVGEFDSPLAWAVRIAGGAAAGAVLAVIDIEESWRLEVYDDRVVSVRGKDRRHLAKGSIVGIHLDRKKVVIDGTDGRVLFDEKIDAPRERVRTAFRDRGYPLETE